MDNKAYLPIDQLKDSALYRIQARNFQFGVYKESCKGFIGIREKFGSVFMDTEIHYDAGGTAFPVAFLEDCPVRPINEGEKKGNCFVPNEQLMKWITESYSRYPLSQKLP